MAATKPTGDARDGMDRAAGRWMEPMGCSTDKSKATGFCMAAGVQVAQKIGAALARVCRPSALDAKGQSFGARVAGKGRRPQDSQRNKNAA